MKLFILSMLVLLTQIAMAKSAETLILGSTYTTGKDILIPAGEDTLYFYKGKVSAFRDLVADKSEFCELRLTSIDSKNDRQLSAGRQFVLAEGYTFNLQTSNGDVPFYFECYVKELSTLNERVWFLVTPNEYPEAVKKHLLAHGLFTQSAVGKPREF